MEASPAVEQQLAEVLGKSQREDWSSNIEKAMALLDELDPYSVEIWRHGTELRERVGQQGVVWEVKINPERRVGGLFASTLPLAICWEILSWKEAEGK